MSIPTPFLTQSPLFQHWLQALTSVSCPGFHVHEVRLFIQTSHWPGGTEREKKGSQLDKRMQSERVRESKTSSSLPCDTWHVSPCLLPICLLCVSTLPTLRGHILTCKTDIFPGAGEWTCLSLIYKIKTTMNILWWQSELVPRSSKTSVLTLKERWGHSSLMLTAN